MNAHRAGNVSRFVNHSCAPNVHVRAVFWQSDDTALAHLAMFAKTDIKAGEELVYDYGYEVDEHLPKVLCGCGAPKCRKWLRNANTGAGCSTPARTRRAVMRD